MTDFRPVAPAADGLALAFVAARRRRTGKAAVSAFGAAVAIASVLSLVTPPGQTLVQEPLPPAGRVGIAPSVEVAPKPPVAPPPVVVAPRPQHPAPAVLRKPAPVRAPLRAPAAKPVAPAPAHVTPGMCARSRWLACAVVSRQAQPGRATAHASVCPDAVAVTLTFDAPVEQAGRRIDVRSGSCPSE
jgi:hypothetical protein